MHIEKYSESKHLLLLGLAATKMLFHGVQKTLQRKLAFPLTQGQRPAFALAALSSYSGFSLPLTIWLVPIAAQTWARVSALESGLACTPPGTEDSYQG